MYTIEDEQTGRFLSWRSLPMGDNVPNLYITYTGKLGTDFFTALIEAEKSFLLLNVRLHNCKANKFIRIIDINPDILLLGERVIEELNVATDTFFI